MIYFISTLSYLGLFVFLVMIFTHLLKKIRNKFENRKTKSIIHIKTKWIVLFSVVFLHLLYNLVCFHLLGFYYLTNVLVYFIEQIGFVLLAWLISMTSYNVLFGE